MKAIIVGRHELLKKQKEDLRMLGVTDIINILSIPEERSRIEHLVGEWIKDGVRYVIIQALPLKLLKTLWEVCNSKGISVLLARMESVALVSDEDKAREIVHKSPDNRTYIKGIHDKAYRVIEFRYWERIKRLEVELEPIRPT